MSRSALPVVVAPCSRTQLPHERDLQTQRRKRTPRRRRSRVLLTSAAIAALCTAVGQTPAANLGWDADGQSPLSGGSGIWDTSAARWWDGSAFVIWPNLTSDSAIFGGDSGVVLVDTAVNADALLFSSDYRLINPVAGVQTITLGSGTIHTSSSRVELVNPISGGAITKEGTGVLIFHGGNSFTGPLQINAGTVALGNTQVADIPLVAVNIAAGAALDLRYTGGAFNDSIGILTGDGNVYLGTLGAGFNTTTGSSLTVGGDNASGTFAGVISGIGGRLTKAGTGTLRLTGTNTYTGRTTISDGTLELAGSNVLHDQSAVFFGSTGNLVLFNSERVGSLGSANNGTIVLNGNELTVGADDFYSAQYNGRIIGSGRVVKVGSGIQQFATGANASDYDGGTVIRGGILIASTDGKLGNAAGTITLDGGALSNFWTVNLTMARPIEITSTGGEIRAISDSSTLRTVTNTGVVAGSGTLIKGGPGILALNNAANTWTGGTRVDEGIISTNASGDSSTPATPLGTGSVLMERGELRLVPTNVGGDRFISVASAAGGQLSFGPGSQININKNGNNSLTLTIGDPAATGSTLVRGVNGTMTIIPTTGVAALGTATGEKIIVNGGIPTIPTNGGANSMVSPAIVSWTNNGSSVGEYLTYHPTNGLQKAVYSTLTDINLADNTTLFDATSAQTLSGDRNVLALHTRGNTIDGAFTLRIGNGSGPAGMIMNIGGQINTSALTFDGSEAVIFTQNTAVGAINAPLSISGSGGLVKMGLGRLTLNQPASYSGRTTVAAGILVVGTENALPIGTDLVLSGVAGTGSAAGNNQASLRLLANQQVASLTGYNQLSVLDLGSFTLTVNQSSNTTFKGTIIGPGGTLHKTGSGLLVLNPYDGASLSQAAGTHTQSTYGKLRISGGTVSLGTFHSLPAPPAAPVLDTITLENGAALRWTGYQTATNTPATSSSISANRGVTLGVGGGIIDVANPDEILLWQASPQGTPQEVFSGVGGLTKTGPGTFRLSYGNTYDGPTRVLAGNLQFPGDSALGDAPASLVPDQLFIDNNAMIEWNDSAGTIAATRGVTIGAGGARFNAHSGNLQFDSPITGGTLTLVTRGGNGVLSLNNVNTFSSLVLEGAVANFMVSGSAGSGSINVNPKFPVTLAKTSGTGDTTLTNPVVLNPGSTIDVRVDAAAGNLILAGPISGSAGFTKSGTATTGDGTLVLSGTGNSYSGPTVVQKGTLLVSSANALGTASGPTLVAPDATLAFTGGFTSTVPEPLFIAGGGVGGQGAVLNVSGNNTYPGPVVVARSADIAVAADSLQLGAIRGAATLGKLGPGQLIAEHARVNRLAVGAGTMTISTKGSANAPAGTSVMQTLDIAGDAAPTARLDLNNNSLIVSAGSLSLITAQLKSGLENGGNFDWLGPGIGSTQANAQNTTAGSFLYGLGVVLNDLAQVGGSGPIYTDFAGVSGLVGTEVLVKFTYFGDADLSGSIDATDYSLIDNGYVNSLSGWINGDFDYSGVIDATDYALIDNAYVNQAGPLAEALIAEHARMFGGEYLAALRAVQSGVVPEPATAGVLVLGATAMLGRRRRGRSFGRAPRDLGSSLA
ncbi:beta strand repeat-containing protein [Fontivita pretiosa]|uniref:beta strand repeat-containing protein n=1 Tax=Fontivita pretiosa TaxID=2989684 RepID=UPI003D18148C